MFIDKITPPLLRLQAIRWAQEPWSLVITTFNCFSRSQVKLHGPAPTFKRILSFQFSGGYEAVEKAIYDCIRALYVGEVNRIKLEYFVDPEDEVVEDAVEDFQDRIINAYQPVPGEEF